jgi:hypothetical protein
MNKTEHTLELIRTAHRAVSDELARSATGTGVVGTPVQLTSVKQKLEEMERAITSDALPPRPLRHRGMGRMVSDSWPLGSSLGEMVLSAESAYVQL